MTLPDNVLVVDLDNTLIKSDLLHETFWSALSKDWLTPLRALSSLAKGKSQLKATLAEIAAIDVATLPYNREVLNYIETHRNAGGKTALVTASNNSLAIKIAKHLGIFDYVQGSTADVNLKGLTKAEVLAKLFGEKLFMYLADSRADLPVWKISAKAVTIGATPELRKLVEETNPNFEHLETVEPKAKSYIKALRPHQWLKNTLLFLPLLAAHDFRLTTIILAIIGFCSFCFVASSVYLINDLIDLQPDRMHATKKYRPLAAGAVPISHGAFLALLFFGVGVLFASLVNSLFFMGIVGYFVLTLAYSLIIKKLLLIDICTLAVLYTLRVICGSLATGIDTSFWLTGLSIFIFLSLASVKRQAELVEIAKHNRTKIAGRAYDLNDLPMVSALSLVTGLISVLILALYVNSPAVFQIYKTPQIIWGACFVLLYWISRVVFLTSRGKMHDDPLVFALKDPQSHLCGVIILTLAVFGSIV